LRLLTDEHYPANIARELRARGHDVISAHERDDLGATNDLIIFDRIRAERRAVLTNNHRDWRPLCSAALQAGEDHYGLILTSDRSLPRTRSNSGRFVELLDTFLAARPAEDACLNQEHWLP
jgi:predicted nuclease of predicted toxin-antitoxin system